MMSRSQREDGFTLVEILVVILIIGILAAIAIPAFLNQRKQSNTSALTSDIKSVVLAHETAIAQGANVFGTVKKADLNATAPKLSSEVVVGTWFVNNVGFCVVGRHANSTYPGGSLQTDYLWYDSALGGFTKPSSSTVPPVGGACANPRPAVTEQAWFYPSNNTWSSNY